jgi:RNA polymerase sigma factor (sigma-70 family)
MSQPISPEQLGRWFEQHAARLVLYARQCAPGSGAGPGVAEDLVQEVFLRLMEQSAAPSNVKAWLYKSLRNAAISEGRSNRRREGRERIIADVRGAWFEGRPEDLVDAGTAQEALGELPAHQREIVVLRIWGQMTLNEVAETVGMPVSSVYDQYKAALSGVRRKMERRCESGHGRTKEPK